MNKMFTKIFLIFACVIAIAIIAVTIMALAVIGYKSSIHIESKKIEVSTESANLI